MAVGLMRSVTFTLMGPSAIVFDKNDLVAVRDAQAFGHLGVDPNAVEAVGLRDVHQRLAVGGLRMRVDGLLAADEAELADVSFGITWGSTHTGHADSPAASHASLVNWILPVRGLPLRNLAVGIGLLEERDRADLPQLIEARAHAAQLRVGQLVNGEREVLPTPHASASWVKITSAGRVLG